MLNLFQLNFLIHVFSMELNYERKKHFILKKKLLKEKK